jgi:hypothetical protein
MLKILKILIKMFNDFEMNQIKESWRKKIFSNSNKDKLNYFELNGARVFVTMNDFEILDATYQTYGMIFGHSIEVNNLYLKIV